MALSTTNSTAILTPSQIAELLILPALSASIAAEVSTIIQIGENAFRIPMVTADPSAAFVAEGAEITPSDPTITESTVVPAKCAGLVIISSELANDSSPAAAETVGAGLARDIARRVDQAWLGNMAAPAPAGLGSLSGANAPTLVTAPVSWQNLDPFAQALADAETLGSTINAWVTSPADALLLAQLKEAPSGSNRALLAADPTARARRTVEGLGLYVSPYCPTGTVYGIPKDRVVVVVRQDAEVTSDASVFYTSDRVAVRAIMRVGFGFPHPKGIVKITRATV